VISIKIVCVGKLKERFYADAANEYIKRLAGYCRLEVVEIPEYRVSADSKEAASIRGKVPAGALVIALCVDGRDLDSPGLAGLLSDCAGRGTSKLCFIIGGSFGLHDDIISMADIKLSLSRMTFPHNLARVILLEQLYRAFKIIEGGKYHK
jgi:23S rRNA (pseudouridine1915-N3)-methyltransferase